LNTHPLGVWNCWSNPLFSFAFFAFFVFFVV